MQTGAECKEAGEKIAAMLHHHPRAAQIAEAVLADWPEHAKYLLKSFAARDAEQLATTEILADAALALEGERLLELAVNYHWTCDRLREEELHFHRECSYRLSTFGAACAVRDAMSVPPGEQHFDFSC